MILYIIRDQRFFGQESGWLCAPRSIVRAVSSLLLPAQAASYGLRAEKRSSNRKVSSYGFKTHRHHQMWGENGTIYLVTSLRAVNNEQSILKICFSFLLKEQVFCFLWLFLKSQCYQDMARYVWWNLPGQCSLPTWALPIWGLFSQKGKKPLSTSSTLFSVLRMLITQGSCSFIWLKILQPITTATFLENHHWITK